MQSLYFDAAATTPLAPEAADAMDALRDTWGNSASQHHLGRESRAVVERSLTRIAEVLGVSPHQLTPTHGGTHGNQQVLQVAARRWGWAHLYASTVEHSSVVDLLLPENRFDPMTFAGTRPEARLLALMQVNNETGAIYDIAALRRSFPDAVLLSDWVQAVHRVPHSWLAEVDIATFSAHKFGGPKGMGVLYTAVPEAWPELTAQHHTVDHVRLAGMAAALLRDPKAEHLQRLTLHLQQLLQASVPGLIIHRHGIAQASGILSVSVPGVRGAQIMRLLDTEEALCVSTGAACTRNIFAPSRVLQAITSDTQHHYPVRLSLHTGLTLEDTEHLAAAFASIVGQLRAQVR
ncbi:aminotransferase class V-fold PLP-dependent enzyme [Candidatus Peribacteria bacterium]|nr:aminotransferase class V-fold PLP-dependent enzyme [Candidatus Peribacteria bacterium]